MAGEHTTVLTLAEIAMTARGARVFRNEVGQGYLGKIRKNGEYEASDGHVIELCHASRIRYGVQNPGGSDLIGYWPRIITPEMIGLRIAQFLAIEGKTPSYDKASEEQKQFLGQVYESGGVALIARRDGERVVFEEVGN